MSDIEGKRTIDPSLSEGEFMTLREFQQTGLLQEVNRLFFHPRGLALAILVHKSQVDTIPPDVNFTVSVIQCRELSGFTFNAATDVAQKKAEIVERMRERTFGPRYVKLGFADGVQPIGTDPERPKEKSDG